MSHHGKTKAQKSSLPVTTVTPIAAVIGVVLRGGQVLLVRRANQPDAGKWGFPGGKIEPGEPIQVAAARIHGGRRLPSKHKWTVGDSLCVDRRVMRVDFGRPAGIW